MPLLDAARNNGIDGVISGITHLALHSSWPGTALSNEITGGGYARQALPAFGAAAAGVRTQTGTATFAVAASTTVRFITGADAVSAGNEKVVWALGGADKEMQIDVTANLVLSEGHGYAANDQVVFMGVGGTMPGGVTEGTIYFVIAGGLTADAFAVSATQAGSAIDFTSKGDGRAVVSKIVPEVFGQAQNVNITGLILSVGG